MIDDYRVFLDVQGAQSPAHRDRGIARYIVEHALAIERARPNTIDGYLVNPHFTIPASVEPLVGNGRMSWNSRSGPGADRLVYHVMSPFELQIPVPQLWPGWARRSDTIVVVTLYDLIPLIFREHYLRDWMASEAYETRLALLRRADLVLAISESTRHDAIERAGVHPERVVAIGGGVAPRFVPAKGLTPGSLPPDLALQFPELRPSYVFFTGGADFRKNMHALVRAHAALPADVRRRHQLVITCSLQDSQAAELQRLAQEVGSAPDLLLTNYVSDETIVRLYQAAHLFVFPSLYEGYGLPIAEAMACGIPVIAADSSSLRELVVDPDARFDPRDERQMTAAMHRALTNATLLERLKTTSWETAPGLTWDRVGQLTVEALDECIKRVHVTPRLRLRPTVALVTPMPPQLTGIAEYSAELAETFAEGHDVHCYVDGPLAQFSAPHNARIRLLPLTALPAMAELMAYDHIIYCMGNSEYHTEALDTLEVVPGAVLLHDSRLVGLYIWRDRHLNEGEFAARLRADYKDRIAPRYLHERWLPPDVAAHEGVWMLGAITAHATSILVHSAFARDVVTLEAAALGMDVPVYHVPFGFPSSTGPSQVFGPPVIASFGYLASVKQPENILDALPEVRRHHPDVRAVFVGPVDPPIAEALWERARRLAVEDIVEITGAVSRDEYRSHQERTTVAVQLRSYTQGEASLTVAECMALGIPTIVSNAGWMAELPDGSVSKVSPHAPPDELARHICSLLDDPVLRQDMAAAASAHAQASTMHTTRQAILRRLSNAEGTERPATTHGDRGPA